MACFTNVPVVSYAIPKGEEEGDDDGGEILGGTGYGRWGRVYLFSKSTPSYDTDTAQNCSPFWYCSIATKSEVTQLLAIPLDASDVFNDIHDTAGFLYGTYSRRFRFFKCVCVHMCVLVCCTHVS